MLKFGPPVLETYKQAALEKPKCVDKRHNKCYTAIVTLSLKKD